MVLAVRVYWVLRAGLTRELVFPCLSPYFERAEKARGLTTPCRVTFERRTFESTLGDARSERTLPETVVKGLKLICRGYRDF